ncbi:hypothetical protein D3C78_815650 [compost metagenome]
MQLKAGGFRLRPDVVGRPGAVGLAEGVATGDQRHGFLIVHRHAAEGFADVLGRGDRVRFAFRAFRVHIDQAHLHRGEGVFQIAAIVGTAVLVSARLGHQGHIAGFLRRFVFFSVTRVTAQPFAFRTPVNVFVRFPDIRASTGKTKRLEAHGFQGDVAGEDDQVGPGDLVAVLLLDRPEQPAGLVEADVVRPAVERCKALLAGTGAAPAVTGAIGACGVPGHADKERSIVTEVRRPPVLGIGHQRSQVFFQRLEVQALEGFGVVEVAPQRVRLGRVLTQDLQIQLVRPPVAVRRATASGVIERAFRFS